MTENNNKTLIEAKKTIELTTTHTESMKILANDSVNLNNLASVFIGEAEDDNDVMFCNVFLSDN